MKRPKLLLLILFASALVLRILVSLIGYHGDLNNNISWGTIAYEKGFVNFYEGYSDKNCVYEDRTLCNPKAIRNWPYSAPNQPPLTIGLFALSRFIWQNARDFIWYMNWELLIFPSRLVWFWDDYGMTLLVKLPSMLADLGIGWLIYSYFEKNVKLGLKLKHKLVLLALWLFNPVVWYNSSVWGQTDAVVNLLGLIGIFALLEKKLIKFSVFFTLAFLFKGSLSIFTPILVFVALKQGYKLKKWIFSILYSLFSVVLISIWFHPKADLFMWLYELYTERILPGEIGYLSANSFNFWWLVNSHNIYDSVIYFGLPARVWGFIMTLFVNAVLIYWLSRKISEKRIFISLLLASLTSFLLMTRIHERYLYPFFPISTIFLGFYPFYWLIYALYSFAHLLNLYNFFWVPGNKFLENLVSQGWFRNLLSVLNLILFAFSFRLMKFKKDILSK